MSNCIFVPRHYTAVNLLGFSKLLLSLHKPGWVGFLPYGRLPHGVAASQSGIIFLLKLRHHAHRNQISRRPAAHQIPHYHSGPIAKAGGRNGKATTPAARRVYSTKAGNKAPGVSSISLSFSVL